MKLVIGTVLRIKDLDHAKDLILKMILPGYSKSSKIVISREDLNILPGSSNFKPKYWEDPSDPSFKEYYDSLTENDVKVFLRYFGWEFINQYKDTNEISDMFSETAGEPYVTILRN